MGREVWIMEEETGIERNRGRKYWDGGGSLMEVRGMGDRMGWRYVEGLCFFVPLEE